MTSVTGGGPVREVQEHLVERGLAQLDVGGGDRRGVQGAHDGEEGGRAARGAGLDDELGPLLVDVDLAVHRRRDGGAGRDRVRPVGRPTSTRSPPSLAFSSDGVPSATTRPASMTVIRSASRSASSRYWVVSSTVVPSATTRRTASQTSARPRGSSPVVGSSRNSTAGRVMRAAAMSSRRRMPPEYVDTLRSAASATSIASSSSAARACAAAGSRPCRRANITRFSRPWRISSSAADCPTRPITERTCACWVRTSNPATRASPSSMRVSVARVWTAVLLPAPFGPRSACTEPARHVEVEAVEGERVAVPLAQSAGFDGWWVWHPASSSYGVRS